MLKILIKAIEVPEILSTENRIVELTMDQARQLYEALRSVFENNPPIKISGSVSWPLNTEIGNMPVLPSMPSGPSYP